MKTMPDRLTLQDEATYNVGAFHILFTETQVLRTYPLHWHTFFELELVTGGRGTQWINGHAVSIEAGSFYLLSPTDLHRLCADSKLTFSSIKLPDEGLSSQLNQLLHTNKAPVIAHLDRETYALCRSYFQGVKRELSAPSAYCKVKVNALIMLLLATLYDMAPREQQYLADIAFRRQHIVLQYIHSHYLSPVSLDDVARVAGLSPNHLSAQFVKVTGYGFIEYLTRLRMQHACTLLEETVMSVTEICYASGFGSLSHFLRTFRKRKQMTPSSYRRAARLRMSVESA